MFRDSPRYIDESRFLTADYAFGGGRIFLPDIRKRSSAAAGDQQSSIYLRTI